MTEFGYAGEILSIDLSSRNTTRLLTSGYADRFIGGRGIAAKLYWDMTGPDTGAFTPDNCKESLVICDLMWPLKQLPLPGDDLPDPGLPSEILNAVTGRDLDVEGLDEMGERIYNVQRAIMIRQGWEGRKGDQLLDFFHSEPLKKGTLFFDPECLVPGPTGDAVSREGAVVEKQEFEKMKDEYYSLRGWHVESELQTEAKLRELKIGDIADGLKDHGLLK